MSPLLFHVLIWNGLFVAFRCLDQVLEDVGFKDTMLPRVPRSEVEHLLLSWLELNDGAPNHGASLGPQNRHKLTRRQDIRAVQEDAQTALDNRTGAVDFAVRNSTLFLSSFLQTGDTGDLANSFIDKGGSFVGNTALSAGNLARGDGVGSVPGAATVGQPAGQLAADTGASERSLVQGVGVSAERAIDDVGTGTPVDGGTVNGATVNGTPLNGATINRVTPVNELLGSDIGVASNTALRRYKPWRPRPIWQNPPISYPFFYCRRPVRIRRPYFYTKRKQRRYNSFTEVEC